MRVALCLVLCAALAGMCRTQPMEEKYNMTVSQLITAEGYPNENHRVETEDGYILQLHRIPAGRRSARKTNQHSRKGKKAILLVHGLFGSSGDYIIMGRKRSLAYLLADAGYDVWLANLRGTVYSTHKNYTKDDPSFWNYSFHEHGKYDAPAMIDTILNVTGLSKIMYIGYSMGTTTFFVMVSERPEYNEKIHNFVGLAPAVYLDNIRLLTTTFFRDLKVTKSMGSAGLMAVDFKPNVLDLVGTLCDLKNYYADICMNILFIVVGEDYEECDWDMLPIILRRIQPASFRQLEHFGKIAMSGQFTSWEGGLWHNVRPYNLSNVRVPVTLLYGKNDQLTEKWEILRLSRKLRRNGVLETVAPATWWPKFNHIDFTYANHLDSLLNQPLVQRVHTLMAKYAPSDHFTTFL